MNFTNLMIAFILAISVVSGINIYAGSVLTAYNATNASTGSSAYACNGKVCPYVGWVTSTSNSLTSTVQKTPGASLGVLIITGIFWVMDAVATFLGIVPTLVNMGQDLIGTAGQSGLITIPDFAMGMITLIIIVSVIGYILFLIIGKGGDNSASV